MIVSLRGIRLWTLLCAFAVVVLGCGGPSEETPVGDAAAPAADAAAPAPGEEVTAPEFESPLTVGTALPEDFPADVPRYPGSEVTEVGAPAEGGLLVSFSTSDALEKVSEHLSKAFSEQGWSAKGERRGSSGSVVSAEKEGRSATIFITDHEGETRVDLFLMPSE